MRPVSPQLAAAVVLAVLVVVCGGAATIIGYLKVHEELPINTGKTCTAYVNHHWASVPCHYEGNPYTTGTPEARTWDWDEHFGQDHSQHDAEGFPVVPCQPAPGPMCSTHTGGVVTGLFADPASGSHPCLSPRTGGRVAMTACTIGTGWGRAKDGRGRCCNDPATHLDRHLRPVRGGHLLPCGGHTQQPQRHLL